MQDAASKDFLERVFVPRASSGGDDTLPVLLQLCHAIFSVLTVSHELADAKQECIMKYDGLSAFRGMPFPETPD